MKKALSSVVRQLFPEMWKKRQERLLRARTEGKSVGEIFTSYYEINHWGNPESRSGPGSSLEATESVRAALPSVLSRFGITSILDIPCGDFHWMKELDLSGIRYTGADIVRPLIEKNLAQYLAPSTSFLLLDILHDALPASDLILCRDCLVHFSDEDILTTLRNIKKSNSGWLLTTTFPGQPQRSIRTGDWHMIDLQAIPFMLPHPTLLIPDFPDSAPEKWKLKYLGLWKVQEIPDC